MCARAGAVAVGAVEEFGAARADEVHRPTGADDGRLVAPREIARTNESEQDGVGARHGTDPTFALNLVARHHRIGGDIPDDIGISVSEMHPSTSWFVRCVRHRWSLELASWRPEQCAMARDAHEFPLQSRLAAGSIDPLPVREFAQ